MYLGTTYVSTFYIILKRSKGREILTPSLHIIMPNANNATYALKCDSTFILQTYHVSRKEVLLINYSDLDKRLS